MNKNKPDPFLQSPNVTVDLHGVRFPMEYLFRGSLVVGQPGSGKTRCILMPLFRSILDATGNDPHDKASFVIVDAKNEFAPFVAQALREVGREDDLIVLKPGSAFYNPLASPFLTTGEMVEKIISLANHTNRDPMRRARGDEAFWANALRSILSSVINATRTIHGGQITFAALNETFRVINKFPNASAAMEWMRENDLTEETIEGIRDFLILPEDKTRPCVATSMANTIYFWKNEPLKQLTTPSQGLPVINPMDIVHRGKVLLISCTSAAYGTSISPLHVALKEHFFSTLLGRDEIEVCGEDGHWGPINQTRPVFIFADEAQSYLTPDSTMGELVALDRLRSFKGGYIAASQNLASIHSVMGDAAHATRLISLFSNQIFMANICPQTAIQAEHILGQKLIKERQKEIGDAMAPPLLFRQAQPARKNDGGTVIESTRQGPRVSASTLAAMRTAEFYVRLANGKVHHKIAPFDNMVQAT